MDISQIFVTISGIALIGLTLWFFFGGRAKSPQKDTCAQYACPMHPWITSSDPAVDCSICGMKLVRRDAAHK